MIRTGHRSRGGQGCRRNGHCLRQGRDGVAAAAAAAADTPAAAACYGRCYRFLRTTVSPFADAGRVVARAVGARVHRERGPVGVLFLAHQTATFHLVDFTGSCNSQSDRNYVFLSLKFGKWTLLFLGFDTVNVLIIAIFLDGW